MVADYIVKHGKVKHKKKEIYDDSIFYSDSHIYVRSINNGINPCEMNNHITTSTDFAVWVVTDVGKRIVYTDEVEYCINCHKWFINEATVISINKVGHPLITFIREGVNEDAEDGEAIKSGEVFLEEKAHLDKVVSKIQSEITDIERKPDYVSKYETMIDYEDQSSLAYRKSVSRDKYEDKLRELSRMMDKPYEYRVDLKRGELKRTFYLGAKEIHLGNIRVKSYLSSDGAQLVSIYSPTHKIGKVQYDVYLNRQFEIDDGELLSYHDNVSEGDYLLTGVTDSLLIQVIKYRRKTHRIMDIVATIKDNQKKIVEEPLSRNLIVQGCAGAGKTMILLQRVATLQHKNQIDFRENAIIITPSMNFRSHINAVSGTLDIKNIIQETLEEYYLDLIGAFGEELEPKGVPVSDMAASSEIVSYVYSDAFLKDFYSEYEKRIKEQRDLLKTMNGILVYLNHKEDIVLYEKDVRTGNRFYDRAIRLIKHLKTVVRNYENEVDDDPERIRKASILRRKIEECEDKVKRHSPLMDYAIAFSTTMRAHFCNGSQRRSYISRKNPFRYELYSRILFAMAYYGRSADSTKYIFIDEGQDISVNEYRLLDAANGGDIILNVFGDTNQLLREGSGIENWSSLNELFNTKIYELRENYRNTNQIIDECNKKLDTNMLKLGIDGPPVSTIAKNDLYESIKDKWNKEVRLAVILSRNNSAKEINDIFGNDKELREAAGSEYGNGRITILYVDEVKGLEFDTVYVFFREMTHNERYVACTRGLNELLIVDSPPTQDEEREKND